MLSHKLTKLIYIYIHNNHRSSTMISHIIIYHQFSILGCPKKLVNGYSVDSNLTINEYTWCILGLQPTDPNL